MYDQWIALIKFSRMYRSCRRNEGSDQDASRRTHYNFIRIHPPLIDFHSRIPGWRSGGCVREATIQSTLPWRGAVATRKHEPLQDIGFVVAVWARYPGHR